MFSVSSRSDPEEKSLASLDFFRFFRLLPGLEPARGDSWSSLAGLMSEFKAVLEVRLAPGVKYLVRESTKPKVKRNILKNYIL